LGNESTDGEQDTIDSGNRANSLLGEEGSFDDLMFSRKQMSCKKLKTQRSHEFENCWNGTNNSKGAMELILSGKDETLAFGARYSFEEDNERHSFFSSCEKKLKKASFSDYTSKNIVGGCHEKEELSDAETFSPEACQGHEHEEGNCFLDESILLKKEDLILDKILEDEGNLIQKQARLHLIGCEVKRVGKRRVKHRKLTARKRIQKKREKELSKLKKSLKA
jgi:hypothetical protein